jgi:hypothetical protein
MSADEVGAKSAAPPAPARFGRLLGLAIAPSATFFEIDRRPTWVVPVIVSMAATVAFATIFTWRVQPDYERIVRDQMHQLAESGRLQSLPPDDVLESTAEQMRRTEPFRVALGTLVGTPIRIAWIAGLFALALTMMGASTPFRKVLAVVAWSFCLTELLNAAALSVSLFVRDVASLRAVNPAKAANIGVTDLSLVLPPDIPLWLKAVASSLSVFTLWFLTLLVIGFQAVAPGHLARARLATMVIQVWSVWLLFKAALAAFTGFA